MLNNNKTLKYLYLNGCNIEDKDGKELIQACRNLSGLSI